MKEEKEYSLDELLARLGQDTLDGLLSDVVGEKVSKVYIGEWSIMDLNVLKSHMKKTHALYIFQKIDGKDIKYNGLRKEIFLNIGSCTINELCKIYNVILYGPRR